MGSNVGQDVKGELRRQLRALAVLYVLALLVALGLAHGCVEKSSAARSGLTSPPGQETHGAPR
jgi:hypothetical protein